MMKFSLRILALSSTLGLSLATDLFYTTQDYTYQRAIRAPFDAVLNLVKDPVVFSSHSLLFQSIEPDTSTGEPNWYTITERMPIVGPIETTTTFRARLVPLDDGLDADVEAALGTQLNSTYTVERAGDGTSMVHEQTTVKALTIAFSYVYDTMAQNHVGLWDNIAKELEQ